MLDQVKTETGMFIGDIDASIDRLIHEMRTIYGAYLPVQLEIPFQDVPDNEDLEVEEADDAAEDTTEVEDAAIEEDEMMDSEEDVDVEENAVRDGANAKEDTMVDLKETGEADWSKGPMGGPDMDESDSLLEKALDGDVTDEMVVRGKRRNRSDRVRDVVEKEAEEVFKGDVGMYTVDLDPPMESTETEVGTRSMEDMAREILEMHARDELLKMSEEKFYKLVEPLCLDVGPFREEFVAKIAALAGVGVEDEETEEEPATDLIELSLSTLDTESDETQIRERLVDNAEYTPAPVINMAPSTLEANTDAAILADEKPQELREVDPRPEEMDVTKEEDVDVVADEEEMREMPFDEELDTEAYLEEAAEPIGEMEVTEETSTEEEAEPIGEMEVTEEINTEEATGLGTDTTEAVSVEESTTQTEDDVVQETLPERSDVTNEVPPAEPQIEEQSLEEYEETETKEREEEETPIASSKEDAYDMRDTPPAEDEAESTAAFVNGVEPVAVEPDATELLDESAALPDTTKLADEEPSEAIDDLEGLNTPPEKTAAAIEGVTDSETSAAEV